MTKQVCEQCGEESQVISLKYAGLCLDCASDVISSDLEEILGYKPCCQFLQHGSIKSLCIERSGTEHDHNDGVVITEQRAAAKITELIRDVNDGDCALSAIFDDGSTRKLFNFYIDELAFFDADLLGKTETEAHQLHSARIIAYIQS